MKKGQDCDYDKWKKSLKILKGTYSWEQELLTLPEYLS
jgi:hypothetical protein